MDEPKPDFIEQLLQESDAADATARVEMDKLRADNMLSAIAVLESRLSDVNELVDREIKLLEEYRSNELSRLDKKRSWLVFNLDGFMRSTGERTIRLPHGSLKLRLGRDKIEIVDIERFLAVGERYGLVRTYQEPDLRAVAEYVKRTGEIPPGIEVTPATTKFSYQLNGGSNGKEAKAGSE